MATAKHDQGYKALFSEPRMVEDLIRGFVPGEWVEQLDFTSLEKANALFVSEELIGREDDVIWRVRFADRNWLYVFLLLEFQSAPDPWMALRVMVYVGLLWQDLIKQKVVRPGDGLPPVVPVVLYNGTEQWKAPLDVEELVTPLEGLRAYRPRCRYLLVEEQRVALEELSATGNLAAALFRLEQGRTAADIAAVVSKLSEWLSEPEQASLRRAFLSWLRQALLPARVGGAPVPEVSELSEVRDMLQERVIQWTEEWKRQGREEGRAEGLEAGRAAMLLLIERRFGPLSEEQRTQVEVVDLEVLADRLLEVERFEDLVRRDRP